jgi:hypothetical protein
MQTYQVGLIGLAIFAVFILIAFFSWRSKAKKQSALFPAPKAPDTKSNGTQGFYVATTFADRPLDRVLAHGLAHRGSASVAVGNQGVSVHRVGEKGFFIPLSDLIAVTRTSSVIDRAVEKDGLISLRWRLGETEIESHFRFVAADKRDELLTEINQLVGA